MGQEFVLKGVEGAAPRTSVDSSPSSAGVTANTLEERKLLDQWRKEIASYHGELRVLADQDPDEAMRWMAGTSARLCEMRSELWDLKSTRATQLRTRHVDPLVDELDRQFKISSRRLEGYKLELQMTRGMT